jgi:hypothetical protein
MEKLRCIASQSVLKREIGYTNLNGKNPVIILRQQVK